jgi:hypothetical protein
MLKAAGEPGSHHLLVGQQGQDRGMTQPQVRTRSEVFTRLAHGPRLSERWLIRQDCAATEIADLAAFAYTLSGNASAGFVKNFSEL